MSQDTTEHLQPPEPDSHRSRAFVTEPSFTDLVGLAGSIGPYKIIHVIDVGGMGVVYLAEQEKPRRRVALKVVRPDLGSREMLRRFELEAQVLGRLQHPGIAQIFQAGTADTPAGPRPFLAMEFIEGEPLDRYADRHKLDRRARLELVVKICEAVQHAHTKGVIHRDLKPGNILVDSAGQPKILDFGLARFLDAQSRVTTVEGDARKILGTIRYMSPEQAGGDPNEVDTRSDVYSLGVLAYELLTGASPYALEGKTIGQVLRAIQEDDPIPLSTFDRSLAGDLEAVASKVLAKEKDRRYASPSAFAADVERYLSGYPVLAQPASTWYFLKKFMRRNKALVIGASVAILALVVGFVGTTVMLFRALEAEKRELESERGRMELFVKSYVTAGDEASARGEWRSALDSYASALQAGYPDSLGLRVKRVRALMGINDYGEASRELAELTRRDDLGPHLGAVRLLEGDLAMSRYGNPDEARKLVEQALECKAADPSALDPADEAYALGLLAGTPREAAERFEAAMKANPFHHSAKSMHLMALFLLGRFDEVRSRAAVLRSIFPRDPSPDFVEALILALRGESAEAIAKVQGLEPTVGKAQVEALLALADLFADLAAVAKQAGSTGASPGLPGVLDTLRHAVKLAGLQGKLGQPADTGSMILKSVNLPSFRNSLDVIRSALGSVAMGNYAAAERQIEPALERYGDGLLYYLHAHCGLFSMKDDTIEAITAGLKKIERSYDLAARRPSIFPGVRRPARFWGIQSQYNLGVPTGRIHIAEMQAKALKTIREFLAEDEPTPGDLKALWWFALNLGDIDLARDIVGAWQRASPEDSAAHRARAQVELKAGAYGEALRAIDSVLEKKPGDAEAIKLRRQVVDASRKPLPGAPTEAQPEGAKDGPASPRGGSGPAGGPTDRPGDAAPGGPLQGDSEPPGSKQPDSQRPDSQQPDSQRPDSRDRDSGQGDSRSPPEGEKGPSR